MGGASAGGSPGLQAQGGARDSHSFLSQELARGAVLPAQRLIIPRNRTKSIYTTTLARKRRKMMKKQIAN